MQLVGTSVMTQERALAPEALVSGSSLLNKDTSLGTPSAGMYVCMYEQSDPTLSMVVPPSAHHTLQFNPNLHTYTLWFSLNAHTPTYIHR